MKLFVGLGNPGERYKLTRHNVGYMVLDNLIKQSSVEGWDNKFDSFFSFGLFLHNVSHFKLDRSVN